MLAFHAVIVARGAWEQAVGEAGMWFWIVAWAWAIAGALAIGRFLRGPLDGGALERSEVGPVLSTPERHYANTTLGAPSAMRV